MAHWMLIDFPVQHDGRNASYFLTTHMTHNIKMNMNWIKLSIVRGNKSCDMLMPSQKLRRLTF